MATIQTSILEVKISILYYQSTAMSRRFLLTGNVYIRSSRKRVQSFCLTIRQGLQLLKSRPFNQLQYRPFSSDDMAAADSSGSSSDTSSPKYDFSDDSSAAEQDDLGRNHRRAPTGRPRRVPTSNSKNAVAARMNRMKQKQYVRNLEQKMTALKREIRDVKRELREREKMWESSRRQVAYLRGMIGNSREIGHLLRNIRWRNIVSQEHDNSRPVEPLPPMAPQNERWPPYDGVDPLPTTELFQDTVPPKHVSACTLIP